MSTNVAYDLSNFDNRVRRERKEEAVKMLDTRQKKSGRMQAVKIIAAVLVFIAIFVVTVLTYINLTETSAEINKLEKRLGALENENKALNIQYESMVDLKAVEKTAIYEYGMSKVSPEQLSYVSLRGEDSVTISESGGGIGEIIPGAFRRLSAFFEYFN